MCYLYELSVNWSTGERGISVQGCLRAIFCFYLYAVAQLIKHSSRDPNTIICGRVQIKSLFHH